jgi:hypothetical protein
MFDANVSTPSCEECNFLTTILPVEFHIAAIHMHMFSPAGRMKSSCADYFGQLR